MNIEPVQQEIISRLLFQESFSTLETEIRTFGKHVIADALKILIHKGIVVTYSQDEYGNWTRSRFYNSDNMYEYQYRLTGIGFQVLEELQKVNR